MIRNQRTARVEAVVLRHINYGEADRILTLYTREIGKLKAIAKGVRRVKSRKGGHLQPFTRSTLMLARGRDLWIITQAETVDAYMPVREDLVKTGYVSYIIELLDRFSYEEGVNQALYRLVIATLERICKSEDPAPAVRYYEIRLLDLLGFRPELFRCLHCGAEIQPEDQSISALLGGVLCPRCRNQDSAGKPVSLDALRYLRHFQRSSYSVAMKADIPAGVMREMEGLMNHYLTYILERGLNSPDFLDEVRNYQDHPL